MRAVTDWLAGRTPRERAMLIGLAVVVLGLVLFYGVVQPLYGWREAAAERRAEATEATRLIAAAEARIQPGATSDPARLAEVAGPLAEAQGLAVELSPGDDGGLAFAAQQAPTAALFSWLAALEDQHGIEAVAISVTENADATLQAQGLLVASSAR